MIKPMIYNNRSRDLNLVTVSKSILNEDKFEILNGLQIQSLPKVRQLKYVETEAERN